MVAKFISGKSIQGALRYNEDKVKRGKAALISAEGYPIDKEKLTFRQKLFRLTRLAALNERVKTNCIHVSLNFDPGENLSNEKLITIAHIYMEKIGFTGQPYLVYRHADAAHPHIHIVSTNIRKDGKRIALHNIGRNQSEKARKEIEQTFDLIPAESRKKEQQYDLKPVLLEKAIYGKSETKAAISNIVRGVVRTWKFTSLAELNAILNQYNVAADRGKEGTRMYEKGGLVYHVLDNEGNKTGVPIKASSIYTKPMLAKLKEKFEANKESCKPYKDRLKNIIDKRLNNSAGENKKTFSKALEKEGIHVLYRENDEGKTYGITFLDHKARVVFNGSSLGKNYGAGRIFTRMGDTGREEQQARSQNGKYISETLKQIDFTRGFASVLAQLYIKGIQIKIDHDEGGEIQYVMGYYKSDPESFVPADKKMIAYLKVNGYTEELSEAISSITQRKNDIPFTHPSRNQIVISELEKQIKTWLQAQEEYEMSDHLWFRKKRKRRKKHKRNW